MEYRFCRPAKYPNKLASLLKLGQFQQQNRDDMDDDLDEDRDDVDQQGNNGQQVDQRCCCYCQDHQGDSIDDH